MKQSHKENSYSDPEATDTQNKPKLKETGMEIKQIAEITGLSEEEIDKL